MEDFTQMVCEEGTCLSESESLKALAVMNRQFDAFVQGFYRGFLATPLLKILRPEELRAVIEGVKRDWKEFEEVRKFERKSY